VVMGDQGDAFTRGHGFLGEADTNHGLSGDGVLEAAIASKPAPTEVRRINPL
jgi:hypothetical protein